MKLTYLNHSAFLIESDEYRIIIDPFSDNPSAPVKKEKFDADFIVLTHAHGDHLGSALEIAKRCNATIIAVNELANFVSQNGVNAHNMHIGGSYMFPFGKLKFTIAHHGSSTNDGMYMGEPAGVLLYIKDKILYHAGDTGLFYDMKLIGELNSIDIALLPIGDNFTMGIDDAVIAASFIKAKFTIPMHYNTFPIISANPDEFVSKLKEKNLNGIAMKLGETREF